MRRGDVIAGLSVSGLMFPEAVAYATIAGLPPARAVMAGIAGCLGYAALGQSRFAIVSPTSAAAAILAAALAAMQLDPAQTGLVATAAVALTGFFFAAAALVRLGGLTNLISRPVLRGFAFGIAVTIILKQLPTIVGLPQKAPDLWHLAAALLAHARDWQGWSVAAGLVALASHRALARFPDLPGALIVLVAGIAGSAALDLGGNGVAMVGSVRLALDRPALPDLSFADWSRLAQYVLPLALVLFAESWGTINGLATLHGDTVRPNRELAALGLANVASALVQGMPVGAGFSAGAASEASGAQSRATAVVAALALAALVVFAAPLLNFLPEPVLAAIVVSTLFHALNPMPFVRFWRLHHDFKVALAAAAAVLAFGVLNGMLVAVALSLAAVIHRLASPRLARLGRLGTGHDFVDLARHPDAAAPAGVAIWRPSEGLFFANAAPILDQIAAAARAEAGTRAIVLSLEETSDLDTSALDALGGFDAAMARAGIRVQLARVHDHVRDVLATDGAAGLLARSSYSVDDAIGVIGPRGHEGE